MTFQKDGMFLQNCGSMKWCRIQAGVCEDIMKSSCAVAEKAKGKRVMLVISKRRRASRTFDTLYMESSSSSIAYSVSA